MLIPVASGLTASRSCLGTEEVDFKDLVDEWYFLGLAGAYATEPPKCIESPHRGGRGCSIDWLYAG